MTVRYNPHIYVKMVALRDDIYTHENISRLQYLGGLQRGVWFLTKGGLNFRISPAPLVIPSCQFGSTKLICLPKSD